MRNATRGLAPAWALVWLCVIGCVTGCVIPCTLAPAPPQLSDVPSDWNESVRANCLENIQRVARWDGRDTSLGPADSPAQYFAPVGEGTIGSDTSTPVDVRVIVHGWAPGYLSAVEAAENHILWWGANAAVGGAWASNWAWIPTTVGGFQVSSTGLFQQVQTENPDAVVLGFSWIDSSATSSISNVLNLVDVYQSEAHTNIAGIRLANALDEVLAPAFWKSAANRLHLIGHSHGSKVATVAAQLLQERHAANVKKGADHLTTLDSPESETTLEGNGANLIGFYFQDLRVATDPVNPSAGSIFVDNYVSYFGAAYVSKDPSNPLGAVVNTMLYPWTLSASPEFAHSYSAEWYGGAAAGATTHELPAVGLAWPPVPGAYRPTASTPYLNQAWYRSGEKTQEQQWSLYLSDAANAARAVFALGTKPTTITDRGGEVGDVSFSNGRLTLSAGSGLARFHGAYDNPADSSNYGLGFDLSWTNPTDGDYLVVTVSDSDVTSGQEVILVLDGRSLASAPTADLRSVPVSFNSSVSSGPFANVQFYVYLIPAAGNTTGNVLLEDFQVIQSTSVNGILEGAAAPPR